MSSKNQQLGLCSLGLQRLSVLIVIVCAAGLELEMHFDTPFQYFTNVIFFDVLLTVHLGIFVLVINQLDAQNFCFTISLFHASKCFEHMCSKHVEA